MPVHQNNTFLVNLYRGKYKEYYQSQTEDMTQYILLFSYLLQSEDTTSLYNSISKMEYLDMVWCETLRKFPLAST